MQREESVRDFHTTKRPNYYKEVQNDHKDKLNDFKETPNNYKDKASTNK